MIDVYSYKGTCRNISISQGKELSLVIKYCTRSSVIYLFCLKYRNTLKIIIGLENVLLTPFFSKLLSFFFIFCIIRTVRAHVYESNKDKRRKKNSKILTMKGWKINISWKRRVKLVFGILHNPLSPSYFLTNSLQTKDICVQKGYFIYFTILFL